MRTDDMLRVSVAICLYNGEAFIKEQLESIFAQSRRPDEIVLLDDHSSDGSLSLAGELLSESGISYRVLQNNANLGVRASFEKCIAACSGDIIFTADQDDVWREDKIRRMLDEFIKDPACVFVFSNAQLTDEKLTPLDCDVWTALNLRRAGLCADLSQEQYQKLIMYYWAVPGMLMAFRRELAERAFPIPEAGGYIHDSWLALCAPAYGRVVAIDEELALYRQHGKNAIGVQAVRRSGIRQSILHMRKVLFYLRRHGERLRILCERLQPNSAYRAHVERYISLFEKYAHYESDGAFKKTAFLLARAMDGGLGAFDIRRRDIATYFLQGRRGASAN